MGSSGQQCRVCMLSIIVSPSRSSWSCRLTAHMEYFGHTRGSDQSTGSCELVFFRPVRMGVNSLEV